MMGVTLEETKESKYLGVYIQNDLRWNAQVNYVKSNSYTAWGPFTAEIIRIRTDSIIYEIKTVRPLFLTCANLRAAPRYTELNTT